MHSKPRLTSEEFGTPRKNVRCDEYFHRYVCNFIVMVAILPLWLQLSALWLRFRGQTRQLADNRLSCQRLVKLMSAGCWQSFEALTRLQQPCMVSGEFRWQICDVGEEACMHSRLCLRTDFSFSVSFWNSGDNRRTHFMQCCQWQWY